MGVPLGNAGKDTTVENPCGTDGLAFIELSAGDSAPLRLLAEQLGFVETARSTGAGFRRSQFQEGDMTLLINDDEYSHGSRFAEQHGPCISAIALRVEDSKHALRRAIDFGAEPYRRDGGVPLMQPALLGIGGSLLYLVDAGNEAELSTRFLPTHKFQEAGSTDPRLLTIDHLTHNVKSGQLDAWADFYGRIFGFREVYYLNARGRATGFRTRALRSACGKICIPINEPTDRHSQIQEYIDEYGGEGVQHLAFSSGNLNETVEELKHRGISFMSIPASYYDAVDKRVPGHGENLNRLRANSILIDGIRDEESGSWNLLLQIFSKPLIGPIFFEFIERRGNEGFGDANARALFEAMERDQFERGILQESE